jgi:hypothetical protein
MPIEVDWRSTTTRITSAQLTMLRVAQSARKRQTGSGKLLTR